MQGLLERPGRAGLAGLALAALVLVGWSAAGRFDAVSVVSLLLRCAHVLSAMVWTGLIVFMNLIHIPAIEAASDGERAAVVKHYVPRLAAGFRHLSHATVVSGVLLLVPTGYVLSAALFGSTAFVPSLRSGLLGLGAAGGLVMWALVQVAIVPRLRLIMDAAADPARKPDARQAVKQFSRINLVLVLPVVLAMLLAAHGA